MNVVNTPEFLTKIQEKIKGADTSISTENLYYEKIDTSISKVNLFYEKTSTHAIDGDYGVEIPFESNGLKPVIHKQNKFDPNICVWTKNEDNHLLIFAPKVQTRKERIYHINKIDLNENQDLKILIQFKMDRDLLYYCIPFNNINDIAIYIKKANYAVFSDILDDNEDPYLGYDSVNNVIIYYTPEYKKEDQKYNEAYLISYSYLLRCGLPVIYLFNKTGNQRDNIKAFYEDIVEGTTSPYKFYPKLHIIRGWFTPLVYKENIASRVETNSPYNSIIISRTTLDPKIINTVPIPFGNNLPQVPIKSISGVSNVNEIYTRFNLVFYTTGSPFSIKNDVSKINNFIEDNDFRPPTIPQFPYLIVEGTNPHKCYDENSPFNKNKVEEEKIIMRIEVAKRYGEVYYDGYFLRLENLWFKPKLLFTFVDITKIQNTPFLASSLSGHYFFPGQNGSIQILPSNNPADSLFALIKSRDPNSVMANSLVFITAFETSDYVIIPVTYPIEDIIDALSSFSVYYKKYTQKESVKCRHICLYYDTTEAFTFSDFQYSYNSICGIIKALPLFDKVDVFSYSLVDILSSSLNINLQFDFYDYVYNLAKNPLNGNKEILGDVKHDTLSVSYARFAALNDYAEFLEIN